jgi:hypothetical protein
LLSRVTCLLSLVFFLVSSSQAAVPSGNEFARDLVLEKKPALQKTMLSEALGKQYFFRYLKIVDMKEGVTNACPFISLVTREPSSGMLVTFMVVKSLSLATLREAPASGIGDAIAATGVIKRVDPVKRVIRLDPVIVRYKDLLAPKVGKEMLQERDSSAVVYSFTGGKEAVNVSKRDEDLVKFEKQIIAERGKDGWAQFLLDEIAKRDKAARAARGSLDIFRHEEAPVSSPVPAQSVITDDEE